MKMLAAFFRMLIHPPAMDLLEDLHAQFITDWITSSDQGYLHPQCNWQLDEGHLYQGCYQGSDFYHCYFNDLILTYHAWNEVVKEVIGSSVGGIVVGEYYFQYDPNGVWYEAPFTHFYCIQRGQIWSARYFMGDATPCRHQFQQLTDRDSLQHFCMPN